MNQTRLTPSLTPHGRLRLVASDDAPELDPALARRLADAFEQSSGSGLLQLGGAEIGAVLPPALSYWRELGARYVTAVATRPDAAADAAADAAGACTPLAPPEPAELESLVLATPAMQGAEYITADVLAKLWRETGMAFSARLVETGLSVEQLLKRLNSAWNVVGRVHFNLALNPRDDEAPFAFLATYTHQLSAHGKAQHLPLGDALHEYAGARNRERLLSLLLPVQRASEQCGWLREMVDAGEIFHPLRWSATDAFRLLSDLPTIERSGIIVRMPASWRGRGPPRPQVTATVGTRPPAGLGTEALLDFHMDVTLDGECLSAAEVRSILAGTHGLTLIRGHWVEVDADEIARTLGRFKAAERMAAEHGLSFAEATRLLSRADVSDIDDDGDAGSPDPSWSHVAAGPWLATVLRELRSPAQLAVPVDPERQLRGTLRPYQEAGVRWLDLLSRLGLGACLADDMGLGKTIQMLALLLHQKQHQKQHQKRHQKQHQKRPRVDWGTRLPSLIVAPTSLLANWESEIARFAPTLRAVVAHPSVMPRDALSALDAEALAGVDLVITSYGSLLRIPCLSKLEWNFVILDEAQAIKNPAAKQTRAAKSLRARTRVALTGTPVENRLSDLWSIFDFINPGLLGSATQFSRYTKRLATPDHTLDQTLGHNPYGPLRELVRPYILRRLKTDRSVISDLPDKTEVKAYCQLSRRQAALYQDAVDDLRAQVASVSPADGIRRRGVVLSSLTRLKQICNHPSQWLGDNTWKEDDSGKFARLRELAEVIAEKQEKALAFTQFREMTDPLASFLGGVFGRPGLVLHGGIDVRKRKDLVRRFQDDETVPFFVISLKAGGSGINLTAASHVIHFDRWWNPAVENQATDRAFRIGQVKNVLVHKFVCRGTVEEKIDRLIESKAHLSTNLLGGGAELNVTEMNDDELIRLVSLDINAAIKE
ncbi:MAG: DEAD/DEAH box helicase [Gemmatimonadaceae bacterium]